MSSKWIDGYEEMEKTRLSKEMPNANVVIYNEKMPGMLFISNFFLSHFKMTMFTIESTFTFCSFSAGWVVYVNYLRHPGRSYLTVKKYNRSYPNMTEEEFAQTLNCDEVVEKHLGPIGFNLDIMQTRSLVKHLVK